MDVALMLEKSGDTVEDICERHSITTDAVIQFSKDPVFLHKVDELRDSIRERGLTFRLKARAQAEELLITSWGLIHSADVSAAVKADLIKSTVKWGDLEPRKDAVENSGQTGGVTISINLGGQELTTRIVEARDDSDYIEHDPA